MSDSAVGTAKEALFARFRGHVVSTFFSVWLGFHWKLILVVFSSASTGNTPSEAEAKIALIKTLWTAETWTERYGFPAMIAITLLVTIPFVQYIYETFGYWVKGFEKRNKVRQDQDFQRWSATEKKLDELLTHIATFYLSRGREIQGRVKEVRQYAERMKGSHLGQQYAEPLARALAGIEEHATSLENAHIALRLSPVLPAGTIDLTAYIEGLNRPPVHKRSVSFPKRMILAIKMVPSVVRFLFGSKFEAPEVQGTD